MEIEGKLISAEDVMEYKKLIGERKAIDFILDKKLDEIIKGYELKSKKEMLKDALDLVFKS